MYTLHISEETSFIRGVRGRWIKCFQQDMNRGDKRTRSSVFEMHFSQWTISFTVYTQNHVNRIVCNAITDKHRFLLTICDKKN